MTESRYYFCIILYFFTRFSLGRCARLGFSTTSPLLKNFLSAGRDQLRYRKSPKFSTPRPRFCIFCIFFFLWVAATPCTSLVYVQFSISRAISSAVKHNNNFSNYREIMYMYNILVSARARVCVCLSVCSAYIYQHI